MQNHTSAQFLFERGEIANLEITNRAILAPMTRTSATDSGLATEQMHDYYQDFAKGGFGVIITEGIYTDTLYSQGYLNQPGLVDEEQMNAWKPIAQAVKGNGAKFIAQLMHAGGQMQGNRFVSNSMAPSAIAPPGKMLGFYGGEGVFPTPQEMTQTDIQKAIDGFAASAKRAKTAGFDGVEIHGANGYLLDQFLSSDFNHREDNYGGTIENRLKFVLEVINAVRNAVGNDFIVGIRLSQVKVTNPDYKWDSVEDAKTIIRTIGEASVDYLHFSESDALAPARPDVDWSLSALAKTLITKPIIANGALGHPEAAETILAQNWADFVAIGKAALANRDWVSAVKNGRDLKTINFDMLMPLANLSNEQKWRNTHGIPATTQTE